MDHATGRCSRGFRGRIPASLRPCSARWDHPAASVRLSARGSTGEVATTAGKEGGAEPRPIEVRPTWHGSQWMARDARLRLRRFRPGHEVAGPALIEAFTTTVLVGPDDRLRVCDDGGFLHRCRCGRGRRGLHVVVTAPSRSSSSRSERRLWNTADPTAAPPSCCWSGWRRARRHTDVKEYLHAGVQDGAARSGLRAAAAQTAVAPARRTAVAALRSAWESRRNSPSGTPSAIQSKSCCTGRRAAEVGHAAHARGIDPYGFRKRYGPVRVW